MEQVYQTGQIATNKTGEIIISVMTLDKDSITYTTPIVNLIKSSTITGERLLKLSRIILT